MKSFDINLDIYETAKNIVPVFTQFDTGGFLYLYLTEYGKPLQLDLTEHLVKSKLVKPDGNAVETACTIVDELRGIALLKLPPQVCVLTGTVEAIVDIIDADRHKTSTHRFKLKVIDYLYDDGGIESSPEYPIIQYVLSEFKILQERMDEVEESWDEFRDKINNSFVLESDTNGGLIVNGQEIIVYDHNLDNYEHSQRVASEVWIIKHNLNRYPSVSVVDSGGSVAIGEITYIDLNEVEINFSAAFTGSAYLN